MYIAMYCNCKIFYASDVMLYVVWTQIWNWDYIVEFKDESWISKDKFLSLIEKSNRTTMMYEVFVIFSVFLESTRKKEVD